MDAKSSWLSFLDKHSDVCGPSNVSETVMRNTPRGVLTVHKRSDFAWQLGNHNGTASRIVGLRRDACRMWCAVDQHSCWQVEDVWRIEQPTCQEALAPVNSIQSIHQVPYPESNMVLMKRRCRIWLYMGYDSTRTMIFKSDNIFSLAFVTGGSFSGFVV